MRVYYYGSVGRVSGLVCMRVWSLGCAEVVGFEPSAMVLRAAVAEACVCVHAWDGAQGGRTRPPSGANSMPEEDRQGTVQHAGQRTSACVRQCEHTLRTARGGHAHTQHVVAVRVCTSQGCMPPHQATEVEHTYLQGTWQGALELPADEGPTPCHEHIWLQDGRSAEIPQRCTRTYATAHALRR